MIKDLFTKKVLAVVCAATLSVGSVAVAFATSDYSLVGTSASASASASAQAETTTATETTKVTETTTATEVTTAASSEKPSEEVTTAAASEQPSSDVPSAAPSEEPTTVPVSEDTYQILGTLVGTWDMGSGVYMTQSKDNADVYTATVAGVKAGNYEYQIVKNNSWAEKFSGQDGFIDSSYPNLVVSVPEEMDVVVTLNLKDMTVKTNLDVDTQVDMSAATVTLEATSKTYNGSKQNPVVKSVMLGATELVAGTDYEVEAVSAKKAGTYTVTVNGIGNYKGSASTTYTISKKSISKATAKVGAKTYTGKKLKSSSYTLTIKLNGKTKTLKKGTDYTVKAVSRTSVGKTAVAFTGKGNFKGTVKANFVVNAKKLSKKSVTVSSKVAYTGKAVKATVKVKDGKTTLKANKAYKVTYKNNKKIGKATVTITGKGNYTGKITKTFKVVPATVKVKSVKNSAKKTMTVKFAKAKGAKSYTVYYKVKGAKKWSKKATKKTTLKLTKLKKGKTYQVKVVSTAKVGKASYASKDSKVKTVKIKK